uniref:Capsid protein n=1 Tax=uncultured marine virus TaxID=186617 RepID=S4TDN9_9VIRU|nr:hypothetical protein [uncultured marine virus]
MPRYKRPRSDISAYAPMRRRGVRKIGSRDRPNPYEKRLFKTTASAQSNSLLMIPRNPSCFPDVLVTDLFYTYRFTLAVSAGIVSSKVFRGNSIFDPDYTVTGIQPKYYDELAAVYSRYVVDRSVAEVVISPNRLAETGSLEVGLAPSSEIFTDWDEVMNAENGSVAFLEEDGGVARMVAFGDTYKLTGALRGMKACKQLLVQTPARQWYYTINGFGPDGGTDTLKGLIRIKYSCKLFKQIENNS